MSRWLLKTEPTDYSFDDLVAAKSVTWDGISNALALKHMRAMKKGDDVLIYHTGSDKAVVGLAQVASNPYPDPKAKDDKLVVIDLKPRRRLARPVTLAAIKAEKSLANWELVRVGRLSVMPVPDDVWAKIEAMAKG
jgi:predicted RNA-binding protein with PUA-like domain